MPRRLLPPKRVRRPLRPADVAAVVGVLDSWSGDDRVTWDGLAARVHGLLGHLWTRQALEARADIKAAYHRRRDADGVVGGREEEPADVVHRRQVEALKAENEALRSRLAAYEERFVRHQYNAYANGIEAEVLERALPPTDKGQTDVGPGQIRARKGR